MDESVKPSRKPKLSIREQIEYMKTRKGIAFHALSENDAEEFLKRNNYFFRIKAYAKNYERYESGRYINLDFGYLKELSILDMHFRKIILEMTINIEHYLKMQLLNHFEKNAAEDGYSIVEEFFLACPKVKDKLLQQQNSSGYSRDLLSKYGTNFALWNIIEVLTFGDFENLYKTYFRKYPSKDDMSKFLWSCRIMRNASAHNNCLLNTLKKAYGQDRFQINRELNQFIAEHCPSITKDSRTKKLQNPVIHDFLIVVHLFAKIVTSPSIYEKTLSTLHGLTHRRCLRNRGYFKTNTDISSSYLFLRVVLDFYYKGAIT